MKYLLLGLLTSCSLNYKPGPTFDYNRRLLPRTFPARVAVEHDIGKDHEKSLRMAMEQFPCNLFVRDQDNPTIMLGVDPSNFPWANTTVSYLGFYKQLGLALGLAEDPRVRGMRVYGSGQWRETHAQGHVSIMVKNLKDHVHRMDDGYLLPRLTPEDYQAVEERYCE